MPHILYHIQGFLSLRLRLSLGLLLGNCLGACLGLCLGICLPGPLRFARRLVGDLGGLREDCPGREGSHPVRPGEIPTQFVKDKMLYR